MLAGAVMSWASGCRSDPEDKIKNWPPPGSAVNTATAAGPAVDAQVVAGDVGAVHPARPQDTATLGPCRQLVELACSYFGVHTDDCFEARSTRPDGSHPETRSACQQLVERFVTVEETARISPCRRYSRAVCKVLGTQTTTCRQSREMIPQLRTKEKKRACLGDLLMWEARTLRR